MAKDPICGMTVDEKVAEGKGLVSNKDSKMNYFCSDTCKKTFDNVKSTSLSKGEIENVKWYRSEKFGKLFPFVLAAILILGTILSITYDFMFLYMGIFFIVFSLFKMIDWKGFVNAFSGYDLIATRIKIYGWIYPILEILLGVLFITNYYTEFFLITIAWITLIIMTVGGLGVSIKLLKREKFQCACLGTWINVPLTKVTLLENLLMIFMSIIIIFF